MFWQHSASPQMVRALGADHHGRASAAVGSDLARPRIAFGPLRIHALLAAMRRIPALLPGILLMSTSRTSPLCLTWQCASPSSDPMSARARLGSLSATDDAGAQLSTRRAARQSAAAPFPPSGPAQCGRRAGGLARPPPPQTSSGPLAGGRPAVLVCNTRCLRVGDPAAPDSSSVRRPRWDPELAATAVARQWHGPSHRNLIPVT